MIRSGFAILLIFLTCSAFAQKLSMLLNLKPGGTYVFVIKQTTVTSQVIRQRPLETRLILSAGMKFSVSAIVADGYMLNTSFDSIRLQLELPNGDLQFNTEKLNDTSIYAKVLKTFKKSPVNIHINKNGKIVDITGIDENLQQAVGNLETDTAQKRQALEQLRQSLGSKAIFNLLQKVFTIYPERMVNSTDKWEIETQSKGEPDFTTHNYFIVKANLPKSIVIQGSGTVRSATPIQPALLNGMPVERNLAGDTYVNISADKVSGWPLKAEVMEKLSGFMIIQDNIKLPGGLAIPININNIVTVDIP